MNPARSMNTACQIFIGCLHPSVVESDVYTLTSHFGSVVYLRILRSICTKESMGLAFVSFSDPTAAQRAKTELNGILFKGRHINVTLYRKNRNLNANIFVKNLPPETTAKELEDMFKQFGNVVSSKISYNNSLVSNRYGYVQFENEAQTNLALDSKDQILASTKILISKFEPISVRYDPQNSTDLYVRGFGEDMTEEMLGVIFSIYGTVSSPCIMESQTPSGAKRYFGFISYKKPDSAQKAIDSLNGKTIDGIDWYVTHLIRKTVRTKLLEEEYKRKKEIWKKKNIFIKNLPLYITNDMLYQLCIEYGPIESLKIHMNENLTYQDNKKIAQLVPNGSAFVCYTSEDSARKALPSFRNKMIDGKHIFVTMWKPKEELVKALYAKKFKIVQRQTINVMAFGPMYNTQQAKPGRGRVAVPQVMPPMMPHMVPRPAPPVEREQIRLGFNINAFNSSPPETQRRMLGEYLYPVVLSNSNDKVAGKITGMLLEIEPRVLLTLINNPLEIVNKVREAIEVLKKAWAYNPEFLETLP
ncbi:hypothetical protein SteCoe_33120 [Stentor coeruleus]|uniref:Polyadenylate-binding protein n=1 Tax=Stentor coeruleus TaxID=5963 RepID=A0A1R2AXG0_9CILI|nr:hypothetical protein SteCoe_33120 [Stentor coeruleus]